MPEVQPNTFAALKWLTVSLIGLVALAAGSPGRGSQPSDLGSQVQKKIQIRVSVRPSMQVRQLAMPDNKPVNLGLSPTSLCFWSNVPSEQYSVRAEWSDGYTSDLGMTPQTATACGRMGMLPVDTGDSHSLRGEQGSNLVVYLIVFAK